MAATRDVDLASRAMPVIKAGEADGSRTLVRIAIYSLLVDGVLMAGKFALARLTGSLALHADALHSLVDVLSSVVLILGLLLSTRKSRDFPFGLYKAENIVELVISGALFFTAYEILRQTVFGVEVPTHELWVPLASLTFAIVPYLFSRYELKQAKRFNSPGLMADARQFRMDVLGSAIVFGGLLGQSLGISLDRFAAGAVALIVGYAAWGLMIGSMRVLLDASVDHGTVEKIRSLLKAEPTVSEVDSVTGRNSGRFVFVEAAVTLRVSDLTRASLIARNLEERVKSTVPNVDRVLIRYGPQAKNLIRYAIPLATGNGYGPIGEAFAESPYFAVVDLDPLKASVVKHEVAANPHLNAEGAKGVRVAEFLTGYQPDVVVAREILQGRAPGYVFAAAGTETGKTEAKTVAELLGQFVFRATSTGDISGTDTGQTVG